MHDGVSLLSPEERVRVAEMMALMSTDWLINRLDSYSYMPTCHELLINELVKRGLRSSVEDGKITINDLRLVKCCASCEYSNPTMTSMDSIGCTVYVTRRPKVYEICETFCPDVDIWVKDLEK